MLVSATSSGLSLDTHTDSLSSQTDTMSPSSTHLTYPSYAASDLTSLKDFGTTEIEPPGVLQVEVWPCSGEPH